MRNLSPQTPTHGRSPCLCLIYRCAGVDDVPCYALPHHCWFPARCSIVHKVTGCYLHATKDGVSRMDGTVVKKGETSDFRSEMSRLKWDGADLRQVRLVSVKLFDDAFSLNRVSAENPFMSHVRCCVTALHRWLTKGFSAHCRCRTSWRSMRTISGGSFRCCVRTFVCAGWGSCRPQRP